MDELVLLVDKKEKKDQIESVEKIKEKYSSLIKVKTVKIDLFDVPKIVEECVDIIENIPSENEIYIHINDGRRTQTIGLLFAAYVKFKKVNGIYYLLDEPDKEKLSIELPKLSFGLNESQKKLLRMFFQNKNEYKTLKNLAIKLDQSRPLLYKNLKELEERGMIKKNDKYYLTDAGKIAML